MNPETDPPAFVVFNEIGIIEQLARNAFERVMPPGLTVAGFTVLNHMVRLGHAQRTPGEIARALQVTKGAVTGTLKRLEAGGLVTVTPDPQDGRVKQVRLTDQGRAAREAAIGAVSPILARLEGFMPAGELGALTPGLQKLRRLLDTEFR